MSRFLIIFFINFIYISSFASDSSFTSMRSSIASMTSYLRSCEKDAIKDKSKLLRQSMQIDKLLRKSPIPDNDSFEFEGKIKNLHWEKISQLANNYYQQISNEESFLKQYYKAFVSYVIICHTPITLDKSERAQQIVKQSIDNLLNWDYDGFHTYYLALSYLKQQKVDILKYKNRILALPDVYQLTSTLNIIERTINLTDAGITGSIQAYKEKIKNL